MKLSIDQVEHVAFLARLTLSEEEKEKYRSQLGTILEYAGIMDKVETEGVPPTYHVLPLCNVTRPDQPEKDFSREEAFVNAPSHDQSYFKVPRII